MTLEQQCVSLDLAKRLKELGVKQESLFWWSIHSTDARVVIHRRSVSGSPERYYSAFTVAELGEMLPDKVKRDDQVYLYDFIHWPMPDPMHKWKGYIWQVKEGCAIPKSHVFGETEADTRAKLLIYLIENQLITI